MWGNEADSGRKKKSTVENRDKRLRACITHEHQRNQHEGYGLIGNKIQECGYGKRSMDGTDKALIRAQSFVWHVPRTSMFITCELISCCPSSRTASGIEVGVVPVRLLPIAARDACRTQTATIMSDEMSTAKNGTILASLLLLWNPELTLNVRLRFRRDCGEPM